MPQRVFKTGNSLAVTIPSDFSRSMGVKPGDNVRVRLEESKGRIIYIFSGAKQLLLAENFLKTKKKR